jgi:hypothetical protein
VHEPRVDGGEGGRIGAAPFRCVPSHVVHHDVGAPGELTQLGAPGVGLQIEHDAALAPVAVEEHRRHARVDARAQVAREVAPGRLHLHDVGAEVGQQQRAVRAGDHRGEVDDTHTLERETGHRRIIRVPL